MIRKKPKSVSSIFVVRDLNSPTCIRNRDACDFVGNDCCIQEPFDIPCWAPIYGGDGMKGEMSLWSVVALANNFVTISKTTFTAMSQKWECIVERLVVSLLKAWPIAMDQHRDRIFCLGVKCMVDANKILRIRSYIGITMPKALFFENVLITRKPSVEVEKLQKVIPQQLRSGKNCNF